ncbi:aminoacyl-tRNA deacylase [Actinomycetospora sp. NBRC 106378]|uniref:aminoacyl-tRNA deacylase n=1 Tax=Actinomycetospora sp. NBRC 106378 TaxID=3032208 RepID=UPI0024A3B83D|nr:aminoacyl-tRNA deacylase [Actinomycetospora sp. NBRC 106378]GLZ54803.1 Cys-tRNA(Pro)/Cys-tRNA(Cys) deacylase [Actinomycetospora sp. NBRC 106378]
MAKRSAAGTPALALLAKAGVPVTTHAYEAPGVAAYGTEAAEALGLDHTRVFKTLVAEVDGRPVLAMVPVSGSLDLKALAAARGGKKAVMADVAVAERLTGSVAGGISPLGSRTRLPVVVDESALRFDTVFCSAGKRGLQMELAPTDLVTTAGATTAAVATPP